MESMNVPYNTNNFFEETHTIEVKKNHLLSYLFVAILSCAVLYAAYLFHKISADIEYSYAGTQKTAKAIVEKTGGKLMVTTVQNKEKYMVIRGHAVDRDGCYVQIEFPKDNPNVVNYEKVKEGQVVSLKYCNNGSMDKYKSIFVDRAVCWEDLVNVE